VARVSSTRTAIWSKGRSIAWAVKLIESMELLTSRELRIGRGPNKWHFYLTRLRTRAESVLFWAYPATMRQLLSLNEKQHPRRHCHSSAQSASKTDIKKVVLVHGAFADGSGWKAVAEILENDGYMVSVAQPPETSYADDQKYTRAAIDAMGGPVVLVGHSYGGSIISEAGNDPNVAALVYIAAFALDEGESCASIGQALPQASKAFKPDSNGNWWKERMMAKRAKAKMVEVNASHVAYMSHPKETATLIEEAAAGVNQ
jgi:pimeloyl-ACP methyl ester carboxylesterase